ncbi:unnamed protein product [Closterium sp. NIES-64]|nr:unnamed protein product [Closterium sp. NIES-64]
MAPPHSLPLHSSRGFSIFAASGLSASLSAACCVLLLASAASAASAANPASSLLPSARFALSSFHQPESRDDEPPSSNHGSADFPSTAWSLLHPFLDLDNSDALGGDLSRAEQSHATRSPSHRLLVAQQQPSIAAAGVATVARVNPPSPPPPPPPPAPPLREVELDPCALQALLPQLFPPALLDPACFNHLSLHSAQPSHPLDSPPHASASTPLSDSDSGSGGGGGDEPETATRGDLLDVARNKWRASTVWAPLEAEGSAEGAGGTGGAGVARVAGVMGGTGVPGGAEPAAAAAAASTLTPPNEVITVCRSAGRARMVTAVFPLSVPVFPFPTPVFPLPTPVCLHGHHPPPSLPLSPSSPPPASMTFTAQPASPSVRISVGRPGEAGARRWRGECERVVSARERTANYIGKLPDDQLTTLLDLLFSPSTGIGFNLARYLLGASFNATNSPQLTKDTFHQVNLPGYKPTEAGPYDWAADWRQRKVLKGAMERGVDEVEAIAYSPPWWMTISGDTAGNVGGASNLSPDRYGEFAEYLATIVDYFRREWNVTFSTMNPANEPLEGWWQQGGKHEGCTFTAAQLERLCTAVARALQRKKLPTQVAGFDSFVGFTVRNAKTWTGQLLSSLKRISVHGYVPPPPTTTDAREFIEQLYVWLARVGMGVGKEVWVSEIGPMWAGGEDTDVGLFMMRSAIQAINIMGASAWIYWQPITPDLPTNPNSFRWGLLTIKHNGVSDPTVIPLEMTFSKKFYMMKQMARASPRGSVPLRIDTSDGCHHCIASFFNPDKNFISIYIVNQDGGDYSISFKFEFFGLMDGASPCVVEVQRTSESEDAEVVSTDSLTEMPQTLPVTALGRSITTIMISNVVWL